MSKVNGGTELSAQSSVTLRAAQGDGQSRVPPTPWALHTTGSHLGIKDADGKFVIRKTVNMLSIPEYKRLRAGLEHAVECVNSSAEIEQHSKPEFWEASPRLAAVSTTTRNEDGR